ncbi:Inositol-pentakisphosphate 2-kinase [Novymonas esmeraldas]|uniref:Inositol-pentakisphosphate 2-kinase n=1 Tax=Novymonas esmeraldas TaxID=1808958 RepID=A0AAW0EQB9_9TRYP
MEGAAILFLGAGKCNVVVDLPMSMVANTASPATRPGAPQTQRAALRIRSAAHKECPECYTALQAYAGERQVVPLAAELYAAIERVVPAKFHKLMHGASEATLVPNFTSDPAQLLSAHLASASPGEAGRVADYTVEVKPKSAWQPPQVIGVVVDGVAHWMEEAKQQHCRYAQMRSFKAVRDAAEEAPAPVAVTTVDGAAGPYCPNFLFRAALSSRDGLQRLVHSPQNNLKVISHHPSRELVHPGNPETLTAAELNGIADAIDASHVLAPLAHLQLYGCAAAGAEASLEETRSRSVAVLDAGLLYHWSTAQDKDAVRWLVVEADTEGLCSCTASVSLKDAADGSPARARPQQVAPLLDFATCLERFYVSTTAKDVSLMIAVSCRGGEPESAAHEYAALRDVPADVGGGCFVLHGADVYRVGVVDLDAKTHKSLEHYHKHDRDIVTAFLAHHSNK